MKLTWNLSYIYYIKKIDFQRNLNIFSPIIKLHGSSKVLVYTTIEIKLKEYYLQKLSINLERKIHLFISNNIYLKNRY